MTYKQALKAFRASHQTWLGSPQIKTDKPAQGEAWTRYIDQLHRSGEITSAQAQKWGNPFNA